MITVPQDIYLSNRLMDIDYATFVDWLEATLLFGEEDFSKSELVTHLIEQKIVRYSGQCMDVCIGNLE